MADMKKVYNDLIIINLYNAPVSALSSQNAKVRTLKLH